MGRKSLDGSAHLLVHAQEEEAHGDPALHVADLRGR